MFCFHTHTHSQACAHRYVNFRDIDPLDRHPFGRCFFSGRDLEGFTEFQPCDGGGLIGCRTEGDVLDFNNTFLGLCRRLWLSGALRYVAHIRYQAHARFLAQSRKNLVRMRMFQLNVLWGGATAHKIERRLLAAS